MTFRMTSGMTFRMTFKMTFRFRSCLSLLLVWFTFTYICVDNPSPRNCLRFRSIHSLFKFFRAWLLSKTTCYVFNLKSSPKFYKHSDLEPFLLQLKCKLKNFHTFVQVQGLNNNKNCLVILIGLQKNILLKDEILLLRKFPLPTLGGTPSHLVSLTPGLVNILIGSPKLSTKMVNEIRQDLMHCSWQYSKALRSCWTKCCW